MNWPLVKVEDFCRTGSGATPARDNSDYYGGKIPWIKSGELRETLISKSEEFVTELALQKTALKLVPPGAILIAMYGATVGRVGLLGIEATTNQAVCHIVPDAGVADTRYIYHFMHSHADEFIRRGVGGAQPNISQGMVKETRVPLPPLHEQKRIAAILDQADALRRLRTRALDRLNALGQAIFHEMFGDVIANANDWPVALLETLVHRDDRINYGVVQPGDHDPNGVPIIRAGDLTSLIVDLGSVKRISRDIDQEYSRSRLKGGEILIGCVGSIGATLIAPKEYQGANIARAVARVPVDPSLCNPVYLNAFLRTAAVRNYFLKEVRLVAQPTLNIKQIKETAILLAPRELQDSFAERLGTVESAQAGVRLAANTSDALFTSLQHRAFQGEL